MFSFQSLQFTHSAVPLCESKQCQLPNVRVQAGVPYGCGDRQIAHVCWRIFHLPALPVHVTLKWDFQLN